MTRASARRLRLSPASSAPRPPDSAEHPTSRRCTGLHAALLYGALALLYMAPAFVPGQQLAGTDYTSGSYMVMEFVNRVIASGHLPTWIPQLMGGVPIFANPGATFHPVRLTLALVLPDALVLPALLAVHFTVAGVGMYLLLRELGVRRWAAFLSGLAFEFTGILASALYAGHDGRFIVAASGPLFLWCLHRGVRTGQGVAFAGAAATLGLALLSFQLQSAYYLLLVGLAWGVYALVAHDLHRRPRALARRVALAVAAVSVAFAAGAVNFLPFADYVDASPRGAGVARGYAFSTTYSMPPQETLGVAVPEQAGVLEAYRGPNPFKFHTEYAGALVVALTALGLRVAARDRRWQFFAAMAVAGLTVAWGGHTPLYRVYYAVLPGTAKFRAPGIAFFVVATALVAMAGLTLERLATLRAAARPAGGPSPRAAAPRALRGPEEAATIAAGARFVAALAAVAALGAVATAIGTPTGSQAPLGWVRFLVVLTAVSATLAAWTWGRLRTGPMTAMLAAITVLDLWNVDRRFFTLADGPDALYAADDVVQFLRAQPADGGRVWAFPQQTRTDTDVYRGNGHFGPQSNYLMHFGLLQAGGEHGNQLQRWNEYAGAGTGTVVLDWHNLIQAMPMLAAAGVRYVVSQADLSRYATRDGRVLPSGMRQVYSGSAAVYRNDRAVPRAHLVSEVEVALGPGADIQAMRRDTWNPGRTAVVDAPLPLAFGGGVPNGDAVITTDAVDRVTVRTHADRAALLVLADNYYPDWVATVDGQRAPILRVNHTFRGVPLSPGAHEVRFEFRPTALVTGLWISVAALGGLALYGAATLVRARSRQRPAEMLAAPIPLAA